ncbi:MAG: AMP-binding protein [Deltaproteobacteria bacterium]|jgi:long-chain acyl-CoA synthetase
MTAIHDALIRHALEDPERIAHVDADEVTTYGRLLTLVRDFAARLGVGPGDRVVVMTRGLDFLVATYGASMAGAVSIPLGEGDKRYAEIAERAGACLVVRSRDQIEPRTPQRRDVGADVAMIFHTSGTTAEPKGVMLTHANIEANTRAIVEYLGLSDQDRVAACLPNHHAYGFSVLNTQLHAGGTIVEAGSAAFVGPLLDTIQTYRCTGLSAVPSTFLRILDTPGIATYDLTSLRYVTQAGAPMPTPLATRVRRAFSNARLFCMYGQTEASARLSYLPPEDLDRKPGSVGIAIPGVEISVRVDDGAPAPAHVLGEIFARGDNVMSGYLGDPAATAEVVRDGWLRTRDMGYLDEDGYLFIVGRRDDMISVAGHRVGPREIEAAIDALPGVHACAVVGVPDRRTGERVVAHVVLEPNARLSAADIQAACRRALPVYMVPASVELVEVLPRSERGKVVRSALRRDRLRISARPANEAAR